MPGFLNTKLFSSTNPILLRNPEEEDAPALSDILSRLSNIAYDPYCNPAGISTEQCLTLVQKMQESAAAPVPTRVNLAIVLLPSPNSTEEGKVIGLSGFGGIDEVNGERFADVGAMVNEEYRGNGYAVESMRLSIDFAFRELGVAGVSCQMLEKNVAIVGLVEEKFGWKGVRGEGKFGVEVKFVVRREGWKDTKKRNAWT